MYPLDVLGCLAQAPLHMALLSRDGLLLWANTVTYGLDPGGVIGRPADQFIPVPMRAAWWASFMRVRDRGEVVPYTTEIEIPEPPHLVRLEGAMSPVRQGGRITHILAITEDVTTQPEAVIVSPPLRPPGLPLGALWVTPLGQQVIDFLSARAGRWASAEVIAAGIGETCGHRFRAKLSALTARKIIEASPGNGYRLINGGGR